MLYNLGAMKIKTYSVSEARQHWAEIIDAVERGEEVDITKFGILVAIVTSSCKKRQKASPPPGFMEAEGWRIEMAEDFDAIPEGFEDYV